VPAAGEEEGWEEEEEEEEEEICELGICWQERERSRGYSMRVSGDGALWEAWLWPGRHIERVLRGG
jgi:hypothetical protein